MFIIGGFLDNSESIKRIITKKTKNSTEWKILEDFCRENDYLDEFFEYKFSSYIKKPNKSSYIKTSSFFENLGVTIFNSVHTAENKSSDIFIDPSSFQDLTDKSKELESIYLKKYKKEVPSILIHNGIDISLKERVRLIDFCIKSNYIIEVINGSINLNKLY
jgi:CRISPR/Cas system CMR-associated protein Cmr5 small subunit